MDSYAVFIHFDLLEVAPARGEQRRLIMRFIRSLAENPHIAGDFTDQDGSMRTRQIKIVGHYAITYWTDEAACKVGAAIIDRVEVLNGVERATLVPSLMEALVAPDAGVSDQEVDQRDE